MARRRRSIYQRYSPQAQAEAVLRTSPERRGLRALLLEAQSQRAQDVAAAHTTSSVLRGSIKEADPRVAKIYQDARSGLQSVSGDWANPSTGVAHDLASLAPAAGAIGAAARAEGEAAQRRVTEAETAARLDLQNQGTRAAEGEVFAVRAANDRYRTDAGKVLQQLTGLDQEQGLYQATELERLVNSALGRSVTRRGQNLTAKNQQATRNQSERNSLRSSGINPDTGQPIPGGKLDPNAPGKKGKRWLAPGEQRSAVKDFGAAKGAVQTLKDEGWNRHEIAHLILSGRPKSKTSTGREIPAIKAVTDQDLVSAALDESFAGYLGRQTQRRLHKRGVKIRQLGVTTYGDYRRKARTPYASVPLAPGANGQNRPT